MLTEIGIKPPSYIIQTVGDDAVISFYENAIEVQREDSTTWQVDEYRMTVRNRKNLANAIEGNYAAWLAMAQERAGVESPITIEGRVGAVESKTATLEETLDVLFGGAV